jgi:signal transduction histidine kinase/CheY-like chemotaxis protein
MNSGLETELRISPKPIIGVAVFLISSLFFGVEMTRTTWHSVDRVLTLTVVALSVLAVSWLLVNWRSLIGSWATLLSLVVVIYLMAVWLSLPASLILWTLPVILATLLIGFPASTVTALCETLSLILVHLSRPDFLSFSVSAVALVGIWSALGIAYAIHHPTQRLLGWLAAYYERGRTLVQEAHEQRMKSEEVLEGLAIANRQLALANSRAMQLRTVAEEAQRAKTAFVANVSHEFRTPLNMIIGLVDLMVETPEIYAAVLSSEMRADLRVIHRNCEHLSNMVDDVLDLTRMETGHLALHKDRVRLSDIIEISITAIRPLIDKKRLRLEVQVPHDLPAVYCDDTRIQQVILNLLSNATRFTDKGGIAIEVVRQDQQVCVSVSDTGPGISPEDAKKIFQPFEQGRLWRGKGSSGLGLSISKRFVELHGGEMWLESELGVGTTFYFTLPISPPISPVAKPGHTINEEWIWRETAFKAGRRAYSRDLVKPRMVVYDAVGGLCQWFSHYGGEVEFVSARDLDEVSRILDTSQATGVLLNASDPSELWSLIETIRVGGDGTPILGCSVPRMVDRAVLAGAAAHLVKPVTRSDLASAIAQVERSVRHILIIDDDPNVLKLLSRMLNVIDDRMMVTTASGGRSALEAMRSNPPDLVLLDVVMDDLDGWQVLDTVMEDPVLKEIPIILVSAQDPTDHRPMSDVFAVTIGDGISLSRLLRCSQELPNLLLTPEASPDLAPG